MRGRVSTHSRPKAAGGGGFLGGCADGFNTQPPEGGWGNVAYRVPSIAVSTHSRPKAAGCRFHQVKLFAVVSTHSRPKAAGDTISRIAYEYYGFNTQPPEGGWQAAALPRRAARSFNTQPPEGGWLPIPSGQALRRSFNTQPPEGGWIDKPPRERREREFQHTAARRRLGGTGAAGNLKSNVSTHSRPKAAGKPLSDGLQFVMVSTHSRPKAAGNEVGDEIVEQLFQHTAARRRLVPSRRLA